MKIKAAVCGILLSLLPVSPIFAHHGSHVSYDTQKSVVLKGTVTEFVWSNPHSQIYFDVKDDKGNAVNWGARAVEVVRFTWDVDKCDLLSEDLRKREPCDCLIGRSARVVLGVQNHHRRVQIFLVIDWRHRLPKTRRVPRIAPLIKAAETVLRREVSAEIFADEIVNGALGNRSLVPIRVRDDPQGCIPAVRTTRHAKAGRVDLGTFNRGIHDRLDVFEHRGEVVITNVVGRYLEFVSCCMGGTSRTVGVFVGRTGSAVGVRVCGTGGAIAHNEFTGTLFGLL